MTVCACCLWTWRWIDVADAAICCGTWSAGYIISIIAIGDRCPTVERWHSHIIRYSGYFGYMRLFMRCRRQWIHCLIIFWLITRAGQFGATHLRSPYIRVHNQKYNYHHYKHTHKYRFLFRNGRRTTKCAANLFGFVGTFWAILPSIAEQCGWYAHLFNTEKSK